MGRPLGSILPVAAAALGKNFTSLESEALFLKRRMEGWGVDPVRMTSHMTSSQTLLMNLLGPLMANRRWLLAVLAGAVGRPDFTDLSRAEVEFAPPTRSSYLGDMTRVDAFFVVETEGGTEGIVLELKYTDRFSTRKLPITENPRYHALAVSTGLWQDPSRALTDGAVSQLLRCHALGLRTLQVEHGAALPVMLVLVDHPLAPSASTVFDGYRSHLTDPTQACHLGLDDLLVVAAATAPGRTEAVAISELQLRYLAHTESESLWREHSTGRQLTT
jgi:hypothetical protein